MSKEIKSTNNGFVIVDEDNNVIEEFDRDEAMDRLINDVQEIKSLLTSWAERSYRLNELTEQIMNRDKDYVDEAVGDLNN